MLIIRELFRNKLVIICVVLSYYLVRVISAFNNYLGKHDYRSYLVYVALGQFFLLSLLAFLFYKNNKTAKWFFLLYIGLSGFLMFFSGGYFIYDGTRILVSGSVVPYSGIIFALLNLMLGLLFIYFTVTMIKGGK